MTDDISEIPATGCNYISNNTTIYNYNSGLRKTFRQIGGKWFFTEQSAYNTIPSNYECVDISELSSNSMFLPQYYFFAFVMVCVVIYLWFSVFRRVIRWRL